MKHLVRLAQVNKEVFMESGVTYLRVGATIVVDNIVLSLEFDLCQFNRLLSLLYLIL